MARAQRILNETDLSASPCAPIAKLRNHALFVGLTLDSVELQYCPDNPVLNPKLNKLKIVEVLAEQPAPPEVPSSQIEGRYQVPMGTVSKKQLPAAIDMGSKLVICCVLQKPSVAPLHVSGGLVDVSVIPGMLTWSALQEPGN